MDKQRSHLTQLLTNLEWPICLDEVVESTREIVSCEPQAADSLLSLFKQIDKGLSVDITGVSDATTKKNLRRLFEGLNLCTTHDQPLIFKRSASAANIKFRKLVKQIICNHPKCQTSVKRNRSFLSDGEVQPPTPVNIVLDVDKSPADLSDVEDSEGKSRRRGRSLSPLQDTSLKRVRELSPIENVESKRVRELSPIRSDVRKRVRDLSPIRSQEHRDAVDVDSGDEEYGPSPALPSGYGLHELEGPMSLEDYKQVRRSARGCSKRNKDEHLEQCPRDSHGRESWMTQVPKYMRGMFDEDKEENEHEKKLEEAYQKRKRAEMQAVIKDRESRSLAELNSEQGGAKSARKAYEQFMKDKNIVDEPWGKSRRAQEKQHARGGRHEPWRSFGGLSNDGDSRPLSRSDLHRILDHTREHSSIFTKGKFD